MVLIMNFSYLIDPVEPVYLKQKWRSNLFVASPFLNLV
jgi:hypothetical protein